MYFWKCWHDSRDRFVTWCVLLGTLTGMTIYKAVMQYGASSAFVDRLGLLHISHPESIAAFWNDLLMLCEPLGLLLTMAALFIGSCGVGEEFATGAPGLLFSRPRKRRYFVWVSWATGMLEVGAIGAFSVFCAVVVGLYCTHTVTSWSLLFALALVLPVASIVYSLTHLTTVLGKGASRGVLISILVIVIYGATLTVLRMRFNIRTPSWWFAKLTSTHWVRHLATSSSPGHFVWAMIAGWLAFSLLFPLGAQLIMDRREI